MCICVHQNCNLVLVIAILLVTTFCAGAVAFSRSQFGENDGPIFLDNLVCSSEDISLLKCSKLSPVGVFSCDRSETAGARCYGTSCILVIAYALNLSLLQMLMSVFSTRMAVHITAAIP